MGRICKNGELTIGKLSSKNLAKIKDVLLTFPHRNSGFQG